MKQLKLPKNVLNISGAQKLVPLTTDSDHKGSRGRSLIVAGSKAYPGAGVLSCKAALRTGSGYVFWTGQSLATAIGFPDAIPFKFSIKSVKELKPSAILIGPGSGITKRLAQKIIVLKSQYERVVIDADALMVAANKKLFPLPGSWISTPHPKELSKCIGWSVEKIQNSRYSAVIEAQKQMGGVVLLKGSQTLICDGKRVCRIPVGNEALAKSGTGDVLAGIITGLLAQQLSPLRAAILGAYIHGLTSEQWVQSGKDPLSMMASDVIEGIPKAIAAIRNA